MRNREIAAHGGCNLFLRPKSKERATNTAFRWGYGVDSKHSKRVPVCGNCVVGIIPKPLYPKRRCGNGKPKEKYTDEVLRYGRRKAADRREDEAASHKAVWGMQDQIAPDMSSVAAIVCIKTA